MKYEMVTSIDGTVITQQMELVFSEGREVIRRQAIDTAEEQVRQALITLGWSPPPVKIPFAEDYCGDKYFDDPRN